MTIKISRIVASVGYFKKFYTFVLQLRGMTKEKRREYERRRREKMERKEKRREMREEYDRYVEKKERRKER